MTNISIYITFNNKSYENNQSNITKNAIKKIIHTLNRQKEGYSEQRKNN